MRAFVADARVPAAPVCRSDAWLALLRMELPEDIYKKVGVHEPAGYCVAFELFSLHA